jgi:hypothetical protein
VGATQYFKWQKILKYLMLSNIKKNRVGAASPNLCDFCKENKTSLHAFITCDNKEHTLL